MLIITYYWPPSGGSGVQRWLKFVKYLPPLGWKPIVVTPSNPYFKLEDHSAVEDIPEEARVLKFPIREPYRIAEFLGGRSVQAQTTSGFGKKSRKGILASLFSWIRMNVFVPDPKVLWVRPTVSRLKRFLEEEPVDVLVTTGPPHSIHLIGYRIKKAFPDLLWVTDYRDPWSGHEQLSETPARQHAMARHQRLERKVLDLADVVTSATFRMHEFMPAFEHAKYHTITNGYDPDDFDFVPPKKANSSFSIIHAGRISPPRNPTGLWDAIKRFHRDAPELYDRLEVILAGVVHPAIVKEVQSDPILKDKVSFPGYMQHKDVLALSSNADVLLLLVNNTEMAKITITGKLFEYMALQKPILSLSPSDSDHERVVSEAKIGAVCRYEDVDAIYLSLTRLIGMQSNDSDTIDTTKYSRENLTKDLVATIEEALTDATRVT